MLLGLALGAAAASALVAVVVVLLQERRLEDEILRGTELAADVVASRLEGREPAEALPGVVSPYILSGAIEDALLVTSPDSIPAQSGSRGWIIRELPGGQFLAVLAPRSSDGLRSFLVWVLAAIGSILVLLALTSPLYVSRNLTDPLRSLLADAGRLGDGSSASALAARASFSRLVELLAIRDRELADLRAVAERRADRAEETASAVIAALESAVISTDASGRLISYNPSAAELLELVPEDIGGEFPAGRTGLGQRIGQALRDGRAQDGIDYEQDAGGVPGGKVYSLSISGGPGEVRAVLATDVTRLRDLERRLAEEAAMAGLGTASAGIAHEMGNTLCALAGFIDLLARGSTGGRTGELLAEARTEIEAGVRTIDAFKTLASVSSSATREFPAERLGEAAAEWASGAGCPGPVSVSGLRGLVRIDPVLLSLAVSNLLRNAGESDPSGSVELSLVQNGEILRILVSDRGPGLPAPPQEVLRPFFSTRKEQGHMGLGLTLARRIALAFGGDLLARDRDGGGAEFELWIPVTADRDVT